MLCLHRPGQREEVAGAPLKELECKKGVGVGGNHNIEIMKQIIISLSLFA